MLIGPHRLPYFQYGSQYHEAFYVKSLSSHANMSKYILSDISTAFLLFLSNAFVERVFHITAHGLNGALLLQ